ncbi:D-alanine--D-alanine ligase [Fervidibacillus halotolerans]|uniref:D-alanine--D-alanine ligase n=1 Tax=Fervidibacillus halotolerans TaxID=2980027 RepID=A0A9E8LZ94_9BACI|nr:D-alanine--D-alanine ligase [Fervidibacillus halotolerans]WAA12553.1 D-alanine--D-alanine ligase [Fervidibacillus halotolerans]
MKKRIYLLYGGKSAEHEVSIRTAFSVICALDFTKYEVTPVYITKDGNWMKRDVLKEPPKTMDELERQLNRDVNGLIEIMRDIAQAKENGEQLPILFPLLHGTNGEDGTVQGLFEILNIPFVGNGVLASAAGMDKVIMKNLFAQAGLPQVKYVSFNRFEWEKNEDGAYDEVEKKIGYPCFVKPANLGSSVGISKCQSREQLQKAFREAFQFDRKIIIEQGVEAREIEIGLLGNESPECSVAGEIIPKAEFYDYKAKYEDGNTALVIPADIPNETYERVKEIALKAFKVLDCSGLVRADFFLTKNGEVLINEINTMPGFTPVSMYPLLWKHTGIDYPELIDKLIEFGCEQYREKEKIRYTF